MIISYLNNNLDQDQNTKSRVKLIIKKDDSNILVLIQDFFYQISSYSRVSFIFLILINFKIIL